MVIHCLFPVSDFDVYVRILFEIDFAATKKMTAVFSLQPESAETVHGVSFLRNPGFRAPVIAWNEN